MELYDALVAAGVEDTLARKAASVVLTEQDKEHLATKADLLVLREEITALELRMIKWIVGTGIGVAGIVVAAVGVLLAVLPRLIGS